VGWMNCFNAVLLLQLAVLFIIAGGIGISSIPLIAGTIFLAFSAWGVYLFAFNKDIKSLFQAKPSNTKGSSVN
jgi:hypothetical protein